MFHSVMDRRNLSVFSTYAVVILCFTYCSYAAATSVSTVERDATKYIMLRVLPDDPALASSLLTALLRSNPSSLRTVRRLLERQEGIFEGERDTLEGIRSKRRDLYAYLNHYNTDNDINNNNNNNNNDIMSNKHSIMYGDSDADATDDVDATAAAAATADLERNVPARKMKLSNLWKPVRSSLNSKRSLGRCIHECINGKGNMNFIQCKSMCH